MHKRLSVYLIMIIGLLRLDWFVELSVLDEISFSLCFSEQ